ncbi:MAG: tetratricopeptide repeat protein [Pseudomonadota bacterium]
MKIWITAALLLAFGQSVLAGDVEALQSGWARANYQLTGDEQVAAFEALINQAESAVAAHPDDAAVLIWQGIIQSTYAGKAGGLGALKWVKAARASLEQAMKIDDKALDGSAYTSLGALYYQVPGWPVAFGSDKKARELLEQAVNMNPDGIDSNYFYGDFLVDQAEYAKARDVLTRALNAAPRPGRELADMGRRKEIQALLDTVQQKLS